MMRLAFSENQSLKSKKLWTNFTRIRHNMKCKLEKNPLSFRFWIAGRNHQPSQNELEIYRSTLNLPKLRSLWNGSNLVLASLEANILTAVFNLRIFVNVLFMAPCGECVITAIRRMVSRLSAITKLCTRSIFSWVMTVTEFGLHFWHVPFLSCHFNLMGDNFKNLGKNISPNTPNIFSWVFFGDKPFFGSSDLSIFEKSHNSPKL